jgi:hypothetical protein
MQWLVRRDLKETIGITSEDTSTAMHLNRRVYIYILPRVGACDYRRGLVW